MHTSNEDKVKPVNVRDDEWTNLLVKVGKDRCKASFAKLFKHFAPLLKGFCIANNNHSLPTELADELVQEVMLKVWSKAPTFNPQKSAANTWIYTVMRNTRIDLIRRNAKHSQATETLEADDVWDESPEHQPFVRLLRTHDERRVHKSFGELPIEQRDALQQVYVLGKTHSEIADEQNIPLGTVKSRIRMGLKKIQSSLSQARGTV